MLLNLHEYIKKVKNGEKIKKRDIVLEFEENEIYEYLDDVNIRNIIQYITLISNSYLHF